MDAVHIHLALNHLAIFGVFIGTIIFLYGLFKKDATIVKISLAMYVLLSVISIPVYLSGEGAEETVEDLISGGHRVIHRHEELAETAIWVMYALGLISILNLYRIRRTKQMNSKMNAANFLLGLVTSVLFIIVGNLGGQIRHTEIRTDRTEASVMDHDEDNDHDDHDDHDEEHEDDDED